jgi:hypothetical protein
MKTTYKAKFYGTLMLLLSTPKTFAMPHPLFNDCEIVDVQTIYFAKTSLEWCWPTI